MLNVGIVGLGFMGMIHYLAYRKARGAKVRAVCEQDPVRLAGDWRTIKGNFGPPGESMDLSGIARYASLDELLADERIDMVDICLPPALHADAAVKAFRAGKHVFCEKPIALAPADAARMVAAADKAGKRLSIGHVLPYFPEYRFALRTIASEKYGRPIGGHFKRIISNPLWLPNFYDPEKIGGPMLDLHVHDAHFIRLVFGMPKAVRSVGSMRGAVVERFATQFYFDDPAMNVTASSGVIAQQGRPFTHGFELYLERATIAFEFAAFADGTSATMPPVVCDARGRVEHPALGGFDPVDAFVSELNEVVRAVKSGKPSRILAGELARDALVLCQKQTESVRRNAVVKV